MYEEDRNLVRALVAGDEPSFRRFFQRYAPLLLGFVLRRSGLDAGSAEDVVQNVLIKAVRGLPQYRADASLYTWLCQICRSELADRRRQAARRPVTTSIDADAATAAKVSALTTDVQDAAGPHGDRVFQTMQRVPEQYARVLDMKYVHELSVEEIAATLGVTDIAAQSLLARARSSFREMWQAMDQEPT